MLKNQHRFFALCSLPSYRGRVGPANFVMLESDPGPSAPLRKDLQGLFNLILQIKLMGSGG